VVQAFASSAGTLDSRQRLQMTSDEALAELRPALVALGFDVEGGKRATDKLRRQTVFRGHDGVRRMIGDLYETFAEIHIEMSEFRDLGDGLVAIGRTRNRQSQRRRNGDASCFRD
jgi:hypothetical protein